MRLRKARLDLLGLTMFPTARFYDRDGVRIGLGRYTELLQHPVYRLVARTVVDDLEVVTVWTGFDDTANSAVLVLSHDERSMPPLVFRTEIHRAGELVGVAARYATAGSAAEAHDIVAARVRDLVDDGYLRDLA